MSQMITPQALARMIDHTLLKPEATPDQIIQLCAQARRYHFASVCINPLYVPLAADHLRGTDIAVCTVVAFPLGATPTEVKVYETIRAIDTGAREIDMVIPIGALKARNLDLVASDISAVAEACHRHGAILKTILETALLTPDEIVTACQIAVQAGADFVKTSTGFGPGGATVEAVTLMRRAVGSQIGVKAAGGIRDYPTALAMIRAGANRIGASASVQIVEQALASAEGESS